MPGAVSSSIAQRFEQAERLFPARPEETLEALAALEEAVERSGDTDLLGRFLLLKGNALTQAGRMDEAEQHIAEVEPRLQTLGHERGLIGMLNLRGILASRRSDYVRSIRFHQKALERARGTQAPDVLANLTANLGLDLAYLGEFSSALALLEESLEFWRQAGDPPGIIPTLINLGFTSSGAGMPEAAMSYYEEGHRRAEAAGDELRQALCLTNWSTELLGQGDREGAREKAARAVELARTQPAAFPLAHALSAWAGVRTADGAFEAAREALEEALGIYDRGGNRRGIAMVGLDLAKLPGTDRKQWLERALTAARAAGLKPEEARCLGELAVLAREEGCLEQAFEMLQAARALDRALFDEQAQRRLAGVKVKREIEVLQLELSAERIRRTEMAELLEEVQVQRELAEEESRQKSAILQIAAHDLRGMISGVIGCLDLAMHSIDGDGAGGMVGELVADAHSAANDLFELLRRLMDMSAIERGEISIEMRVVNPADVLHSVLRRWRQTVDQKAQGLEVVMNPSLHVRADPDRLRQMVSNLVSNASKYSPLGSVIEIRLDRSSQGRVRLSVLDRGPGLSGEDRSRMFRPFQRLSARPTGGEQSTGLGLHIVKALADKQGATLGYATRTGGGSEFFIEFEEAALAAVAASL